LNSFDQLFDHGVDVEPYRMPGVQQWQLENEWQDCLAERAGAWCMQIVNFNAV